MKKVVLLQRYLAPYRIPVFNRLANHPDIHFTLMHYGGLEKRRKWSLYQEVSFHERKAKKIVFKLSYTKNLEIPYSLPLALRKLNPDVIICAPDLGGLCAYLYSKGRPCSYIIWSEATATTEQKRDGFLRERLRRRIYGGAESFIVPGRLAREYICRFRPDAKFYFANNSVDEETFRVSREEVIGKFESKKLVVTFSGSLLRQKGIIILLNAFKKLLTNDILLRERLILRILGAGPIDLSSEACENILLEGFCNGSKYRDFIKNSHVFILPSLSDCNPLTVIEGLFAGNIIIVSDAVGNYPEALKDNGVIIRSNSEDAVYNSLRDILMMPPRKRVERALKSLELSKDFTSERSARGFIDAILRK